MAEDKKKSALPKTNRALFEAPMQKAIRELSVSKTALKIADLAAYEFPLQKAIRELGISNVELKATRMAAYETPVQKAIRELSVSKTALKIADLAAYEFPLQKAMRELGISNTALKATGMAAYETPMQKAMRELGVSKIALKIAGLAVYEFPLQKAIRELGISNMELKATGMAAYEIPMQKAMREWSVSKTSHSSIVTTKSSFVSNPSLSMQVNRLDKSVSSIVDKLFTTVYEEKSEPDLVSKFQEISKKFENYLETPEVPEEFVTDIMGIKESIDSMDNSDLKNELNLISSRFRVANTTFENKVDSQQQLSNIEMVIRQLCNQLENLSNKLNHVTKLINEQPTSSKKSTLEEIKSKLTIAVIIITIVIQLLSGFISKAGETIFEESQLPEKIHEFFHPDKIESNTVPKYDSDTSQEPADKIIDDIKNIQDNTNETNLV